MNIFRKQKEYLLAAFIFTALSILFYHEIIFNKLPEGWSLHHGNGTIIMHSMDGSRLIEKMLFEYVGDFHVESAIVGDWDGNSISVNLTSLPNHHALSPAYPNPFNPKTTLNFNLQVDERVSIYVYNMQGQMIESLMDEEMQAGNHSVTWNADAFGSGIYLVKMLSGGLESTQKITLIK